MDKPKDKLSDQNQAKITLLTLAAKAIARMTPEEAREFSRKAKERIASKKQKEVKPDWITDEQWEAIPYSDHWLNQKKGAEYIKQSKPATPEESKAQFERLRNEKNWKEGG